VIASGILLDTGPLVALLSRHDSEHQRAVRAFAACLPPFRCCEAVVAEACFLMRKVHSGGPAEVVGLYRKGVYEVSFALRDHATNVETLLRKYADQPISLADACLIRTAEIYHEPRILTFDTDFTRYRWSRGRRFEVIASG
jgi:uncharacterized protein